MKSQFGLKRILANYQLDLLRFLKKNQSQIMILVIVALGFLYLKQTSYFRLYWTIDVRTIVFFIWLLAILTMEIPARWSFVVAVLTSWACFLLEIVGFHFWALRLVTYTYYFLGAGFLRYLLELHRARIKSSRD